MDRPRVLVIDDERNFRQFLGEALRAEEYPVDLAATAESGLALAAQRPPGIVLLDQKLPDRPGVEIIPELREVAANPAVVIITAYGEYPQAVKAVKLGAFQYLTKPFGFEELLRVIEDAWRSVPRSSDGEQPPPLARIVGDSPAMRSLKRNLVQVAKSPVDTVLLQGESGSGKELVAGAIHALSSRGEERLISLNCAALTDTLLMSELFGHERGAFTDARDLKEGVFEAAAGGTLFLDEIGEMSLGAQAALLRAVEQRTVTRVGGTEEIPVDVRVIAATNTSLDRQVACERFRPDLFYRLNVVQLTIPPLRERGGDVILLAEHFADFFAGRYGIPRKEIPPDVRQRLRAYHWPGNVRELRNMIERAYVVGKGSKLRAKDVKFGAEGDVPQAASMRPAIDAVESGETFTSAKRRVIDRFEKSFLRAALSRSQGNVSQAARHAGMHRQALQRLLRRHDITREQFLE